MVVEQALLVQTIEVGGAEIGVRDGVAQDVVGGDDRLLVATGLRDVLAHSYFVIDDETLWDIVRSKIPQLLAAVKQLRKNDT